MYFDTAHFNYHFPEGSYWPLAELLRRDGYVVRSWEESFTRAALDSVDILIISNALSERNAEEGWSLPTPSAFTQQEIDALSYWVQGGVTRFGEGGVALFGEAAMFRILTPVAGSSFIGQTGSLP